MGSIALNSGSGLDPQTRQQKTRPDLLDDYPRDTGISQQASPHKATTPRRGSVAKQSRTGGSHRAGRSSDTSTKASSKRYEYLEETRSDQRSKREIDLEKNRKAAARCRERQKQKTDHLQEHAQELAAENVYLKESASELRATLLDLKTECLRHTDCHCQDIRHYLLQSVDTIVGHDSPDILAGTSDKSWIASPEGSQSMDASSPGIYWRCRNDQADIRSW